MGYASSGTPPPLVVYEWDYYGDDQAIQGTWGNQPNLQNWEYNVLSNDNTRALNDEVALTSFFVPEAGVYTIHMSIVTDVGQGIIHVEINGVDVVQIDGYSGGIVYNVQKSASLGALTVGNKVIRLKMASKHGSATDYRLILQNLTIVKED